MKISLSQFCAFVGIALLFSSEAGAQTDPVYRDPSAGKLRIHPQGPATVYEPRPAVTSSNQQMQRIISAGQQPSRVFGTYDTVPAMQPGTVRKPGDAYLAPTDPTSVVRRPTPTRERTGGLEELFRLLEARKRPLEINLWFPGVDTLTNTEIAQGAAVVQGIALRVGNTPITVTSNPGIETGKLNVVVGLTRNLAAFVQENDLKAEGNGHLLLKEIAYRRDTHLLVVTGRTPEGLDNAILSLGIARERLPGAPFAAIANIVLPKAPPFLRREPLREESAYTFLQLHEIGVGMAILPNRRFRMEFALPGDFNPQYDGEMVIDLHFSYPGIEHRRPFVGERVTVKLDHAPDETISGEVVPIVGGGARSAIGIPARLLQIGANALEITFPVATGGGLQIYSDSTMALPPWKHQPTLPDLYIFSRTVYPWIGQPDGSELFVYLAGGSTEAVESTWTLMAKLAQVSNTMFYAAEYSAGGDLSQLNRERRHVIVVGDIDSIPEAYRVGMPKDVFRELEEVFENKEPVRKGINLKDVIMMLVEKFREKTGETTAAASQPDLPKPVLPAEDRQQRGFLGAFPPKEKEHGWVLMMAAQTPDLLRQRTDQLVMPEFWQHLKGGSVFWYDTPESLRVYSAPVPTIKTEQEKINPNLFVEMPFGERYSVKGWHTALAGFFLFLLLVLIQTIRRYANMRDYQ